MSSRALSFPVARADRKPVAASEPRPRLTICVRWAGCRGGGARHRSACEQPGFGYQHGKCAAAPETDRRSGRRVSSGGELAPVRGQLGPGPGQGKPGQWAAEATYDIPEPDRTRPFSFLRPGPTLGRNQERGRAAAWRAVGLDVPVRHPAPHTRRTRRFLKGRFGPWRHRAETYRQNAQQHHGVAVDDLLACNTHRRSATHPHRPHPETSLLPPRTRHLRPPQLTWVLHPVIPEIGSELPVYHSTTR